MKTLSLAGLAAILLSTTAFGADLMVPDMPDSSGPDVAGYFSLQGGGQAISNDFSNGNSIPSQGGNVSAAARIGVVVDPRFSVQADLWYRYFYEQRNNAAQTSCQDQYPGAAVHLSWHPNSDANLVGLFGSLGQTVYTPLHNNTDSPGTSNWATQGIEGVWNLNDNWRLYGQAGVIEQLSGPIGTGNDRVGYGVLQATYYLTPNFTVSGWGGLSAYTDNYGTGKGGRIGGRIEFKPDGSPVSLYASYQGRGSWDTITGGPRAGQTESLAENTVMVGLRVPFGASSLQDLDRSAGLVDMNTNYGEFPQ